MTAIPKGLQMSLLLSAPQSASSVVGESEKSYIRQIVIKGGIFKGAKNCRRMVMAGCIRTRRVIVGNSVRCRLLPFTATRTVPPELIA
jgi:hypothetical protein